MYWYMCNNHATAGRGNYKMCIFKGGRQLGTFNRLNCIFVVSVFTVAAPYICVIVTGSSTVPGVT